MLATITPNEAVYSYHFNGTGNTIAITNANKNVVNKYAYNPFGKIVEEDETEVHSQPFKFVGQFGVTAESNGLYYMRARYYYPEVGRFISQDPMGLTGGDVNLYVYARNNPLIYIDPLGLYSMHDFLVQTYTYAGIATTATAITGLEPGAIVFGGIGAVALGIDLSLYSENKYFDTGKEILKMILPVKEPYNMFTEQAIDDVAQRAKNKWGKPGMPKKQNCP